MIMISLSNAVRKVEHCKLGSAASTTAATTDQLVIQALYCWSVQLVDYDRLVFGLACKSTSVNENEVYEIAAIAWKSRPIL